MRIDGTHFGKDKPITNIGYVGRFEPTSRLLKIKEVIAVKVGGTTLYLEETCMLGTLGVTI